MKYDAKNKILYKVNPMAQACIGRFFGYMSVFFSYADTIPYDRDRHEVKFTYDSLSKWNQLVKNIL